MAEILTAFGQSQPLEDLSMESFQAVVGGYVEAVRLKDGDVLLVDEDAKLKGKAPNRAASAMAGQLIVGDVVLCSRAEFREATLG